MSFATEATAPSEVVRRITDACVKAAADGPTVNGRPLPMNRTARRAVDARRAATKSTGTSARAKSLPSAWPRRPGPTIAIPFCGGLSRFESFTNASLRIQQVALGRSVVVAERRRGPRGKSYTHPFKSGLQQGVAAVIAGFKARKGIL